MLRVRLKRQVQARRAPIWRDHIARGDDECFSCDVTPDPLRQQPTAAHHGLECLHRPTSSKHLSRHDYGAPPRQFAIVGIQQD